MLDSAGRIQRYYILVEPNVKSANKTEKIEKKVKKVNENGNDSKYYSAGTAELNYTLVTSPNIVFECNLINPETIDNYIESYKEEVSDIKYGEDKTVIRIFFMFHHFCQQEFQIPKWIYSVFLCCFYYTVN